jgi:enamine deaminase RidA (YjgF/YER057c/UK114 family)
MKTEIETGLPSLGQPFSWAIASGDLIFTSHGPVTPQGTILDGDITAQTRCCLDNLQTALTAAGVTLADVVQVQLYILDVADMKAVDAVYAQVFPRPYPTRCTVVAAGLVAPGMRIELMATARKPMPPQPA